MAPGKSYWDVVLGHLLRPAAAKCAVGYVAILVLLAGFIPFLANSRPYTAVIPASPGHPAQRIFPLFRSLTNVDYLWLISVTAVLLYLPIYRRTAKCRDLLLRRSMRMRWLGGLLLAAILGGLLIACFHRNYLDAHDYHRMAHDGRITHAIFAPIPWGYATMEPLEKNLVNKLPSTRHWLGTDGDGRDELARLLWSARVAMEIGFVSQIIALAIGIVMGSLVGYFVGVVDLVGMRIVEMVEGIPTFFLILIFIAIYGRDIFVIMLIFGVTGWTGIARFIRAEFLRIRKLDYVTAAIAAGLPRSRVMLRHMLPNGLTPVLVSVSFGIAGAITSESGLSYLGVGVNPPTASWGQMLNAAGQPGVVFRWWQAMGPGVALFLAVLAFYIIGNAARDAIDPRHMSST